MAAPRRFSSRPSTRSAVTRSRMLNRCSKIQPLFKNHPTTPPPPPPTPPHTASPPPPPAAAATPAPPEPPAPAKTAAPHARDRDRASINGAVRLEGPFASEGGMGVVLLAPVGGGRSPRAIHAQVEQR